MDKENELMSAVKDMDMTQGTAEIKEIMDKFVGTASVDAVYGKPVKSGDLIIIPAAEVMCGMGFGMGMGFGIGPESEHPSDESSGESADDEKAEEGEVPSGGAGSGGGGGGYTFSRPVALVISSPDGVRVEPVIDRTKILIAALTTAGFMVGMMARMMKGVR